MVAIVASLAPGEVVSYADVAEDAGWPGRARAVGRILATTEEHVPWWRVVNAAGRLVPGMEDTQAELLRGEGVEVRSDRVRRARFGRFAPPSGRLSPPSP